MRGKTAFFTVLQLNPSTQKIIRPTVAHGKAPASSIAIALHEKKKCAKAEFRASGDVSLSQESLSLPCLLRLDAIPADMLMEGLSQMGDEGQSHLLHR